jgi:hypothetical protein
MTPSRYPAKQVAAALALAFALLIPASARAAQPGVSVPIVGTVGGGGGTFSGVFTATSFAIQNGQLVAVGTLTGALTTAAGTTGVLKTVALPAAVTQAACEILHLDIGPIFLDLLGLQVDLSRVVLDISAQPGPGNLLGNLLCSVAGLLDDPTGLARLLNQILAIL